MAGRPVVAQRGASRDLVSYLRSPDSCANRTYKHFIYTTVRARTPKIIQTHAPFPNIPAIKTSSASEPCLNTFALVWSNNTAVRLSCTQ